MIEQVIERWHLHLQGKLEGGLDALLAEDCVFYSPIVYSPQKGKDLTKLYLNAAGNTFSDGKRRDEEERPDLSDTGFHYIKEVMTGHHAVLEFETQVEGKYINGIDMITCNDEGMITEFKVMVRPLQAINLLHQKMAAMLEKMNKG